ncbi:MAG: hypothetical protein GY861_16725 [bacterium]|nr:hypothetical protein [bacterium]
MTYSKDDQMLEVNATEEDVKFFLNSALYQDYLREIDVRLDETTHLLDDFEGVYTGRDYDKFRGRKRNLLELRELFQDIYNGLQEVREAEENSNE